MEGFFSFSAFAFTSSCSLFILFESSLYNNTSRSSVSFCGSVVLSSILPIGVNLNFVVVPFEPHPERTNVVKNIAINNTMKYLNDVTTSS